MGIGIDVTINFGIFLMDCPNIKARDKIQFHNNSAKQLGFGHLRVSIENLYNIRD